LLIEAIGGAAALLAGEEVPGDADAGVLEGEAIVAFFFFSGTGETRGSNRPASSEQAPVLLAPVSSNSGGETKSSSARGCFDFGVTRPKLVLPP
jgi:hypothetical protein